MQTVTARNDCMQVNWTDEDSVDDDDAVFAEACGASAFVLPLS